MSNDSAHIQFTFKLHSPQIYNSGLVSSEITLYLLKNTTIILEYVLHIDMPKDLEFTCISLQTVEI